jgi:putative endonuclease
MPYYVYILTTKRNGTLYTGVTNDLVRRSWEHQEAFVKGFTSQYNVKKLVWYEVHDDPLSAITREKQIKKWNRAWKIRRIDDMNPNWTDLTESLF